MLSPTPSLLEADEHADAVIDVDDEIADLEIAKVRKKRLGGRTFDRRAPLFFEDIGFCVDLQAGVGQTKSARQAANRDQHRGVLGVLGPLDRDRKDVVFLQQLDGSFRSTGGGGDKQRLLAFVAQSPDLGDPVRDAALEFHGGLTADVN